jgi:glycosyltransferase involved in cell wall biosynthesis
LGPRISLIIPAFNEEKYLGATLDSLFAAARAYEAGTGRAVEFIVVDNASTDRTAEVAASRGARVVREPVRQIAAARNRGVGESRGELVVTCDADNRVSPNVFLRIDELMSGGGYVGGGVRIRPERSHWTTDLMFGTFDLLARAAGTSFGMLYTDRDTFRRIGGFPTDVYVGEDALFVWALKREARRLGKRYANPADAYIVTSLRKIDEYGFLPQLFTYLKFLLLPWTIRRRASCPTWYDVRGKAA